MYCSKLSWLAVGALTIVIVSSILDGIVFLTITITMTWHICTLSPKVQVGVFVWPYSLGIQMKWRIYIWHNLFIARISSFSAIAIFTKVCIQRTLLKMQLLPYAFTQWRYIWRLRYRITARRFRRFLRAKTYWIQWLTTWNIGRNSKMMRCAVTPLPCFFNKWLWIEVCDFQIKGWINVLHLNCNFNWCK